MDKNTAIVGHIVDAFNVRARELGYGPMSSACLPIKVEDVLDKKKPRMGRESQQPVSDCRSLCTYFIGQHILVRDEFAGRDRQMSIGAMAILFYRSPQQITKSLKRGCWLLDNQLFAAIYEDSIKRVSKAGIDLWRPPHRTMCE